MRSQLEKQIDDGMSFADRKEPVGKYMPKDLKKHINLLQNKQLTDTES